MTYNICNLFFAANTGKEFYFGFMQNSRKNTSSRLTIDIAASDEGYLFIEVPFLNISRHQNIQNGTTTIEFDKSLSVFKDTLVENRGVYINTTVNVAVFVTNFYIYGSATYTAFPVAAMGTEYRSLSFKPRWTYEGLQFIVIGIHDSTLVFVTFPNGTQSTKVINRLDCYHESNEADISGTLIETDKPVSIVSGAPCASFIQYACDIIMTQLLPTTAWDQTYIVPSLSPLQTSILRIAAAENDTEIHVRYSNANQTWSSTISDTSRLISKNVTTDKTMTVQSENVFQLGVYAGRVDVSLFLVPGISQYLNEYVFVISSFYDTFTNYFAAIIPNDVEKNLVLDGRPLTPRDSFLVPAPFENYSVVIHEITSGYHQLRLASNEKFGAVAFGVYDDVHYAFPVGMNLEWRATEGR